eukprot:IDg720t1
MVEGMLVGQSPRGRGRRDEVVLDGLGSGTRLGVSCVTARCSSVRGRSWTARYSSVAVQRKRSPQRVLHTLIALCAGAPCAQDRLVRRIALCAESPCAQCRLWRGPAVSAMSAVRFCTNG